MQWISNQDNSKRFRLQQRRPTDQAYADWGLNRVIALQLSQPTELWNLQGADTYEYA